VSVPRTDHTYVDAEGITIHYYAWVPQHPRAVLQIAHGLGEYASRYEQFAQDLAAAGFAVYADDHRGHGQTGLEQHNGDATRLGRLGPGGLRATIAAIRQFTSIIRQQHPDVPLAVIGQSWGSLMVQKILDHHPGDYDAVILAGTAHRLLGSMNSGQLNAKHKHLGDTGYEWLSRDPAVSKAFQDDPLTFYADVLKLFGVADGLRLFGNTAKPIDKDVPVLIVIGSEDSLGGEKSVRNLANAYLTRSRLTDVEVVVYDGARHDLFNETNRDEVVADIITWLDQRLRLAPA
jgi:alpha-beta hydrolase superfamily lysophospholipase